MTRRDRVMNALNFRPTDRVPKDLGGMPSTCVSCFAYPGLVRALGLPPRRPRVYDTGQMLALPDTDVLDALDCDVVTLTPDMTNAFPQPELWKPYGFNGRLDAEVRTPAQFQDLPDGTILQPHYGAKMPPAAHVFETEHAGQPMLLTGDLPKPDLDELRARFAAETFTPTQIAAARETAQRAREATDRATLFLGPGAGIGIANFGGLALFPMLCLTEPEFVAELHELVIAHALRQVEALLPEIAGCVDVYMVSADDWGTQNAPIAAPWVYGQLFQPYYRRMNDLIHQVSPQTKTFLHTCGAVYDLLDAFVDSGFDVVNPVQWTAGGRSWREWKDKTRGRLALWGGGVNSQATLPLGTPEDVAAEVRRVVPDLADGGGYVFCAIHNILAEIPPENITALYRAAAEIPGG